MADQQDYCYINKNQQIQILNHLLMFWIELFAQPILKSTFLTIVNFEWLHNFTEVYLPEI